MLSTYFKSLRSVVALVFAGAALSVLSCTSERSSTPAPSASGQVTAPASQSPLPDSGGYILTIEPRDPNRRTTLALSVVGFALQDGRVAWQVNGVPLSANESDRFDCAGMRRGDTVRAVAVVNGREVRSNEVTIGNTPPELTNAVLRPAKFGQAESLAVSATTSDADDDKVTIQYSWTVNDLPAGNGENLGRALKRNDRVRVEVVAHDGQAYGNWIRLNQTIANHPPVFVERRNFAFSGGIYAYQAQAIDEDDDPITYSLDSPVAGMSIDRTTGKVTWNVPVDFRGEQSVTLVADDGHSGTARYTVTFKIRE